MGVVVAHVMVPDSLAESGSALISSSKSSSSISPHILFLAPSGIAKIDSDTNKRTDGSHTHLNVADPTFCEFEEIAARR